MTSRAKFIKMESGVNFLFVIFLSKLFFKSLSSRNKKESFILTQTILQSPIFC